MNNKPITLMREDFMANIVNLCNNSGLPFFIIEDVLKNLLQEIHAASLKQLEVDRERYKESQKKNAGETE